MEPCRAWPWPLRLTAPRYEEASQLLFLHPRAMVFLVVLAALGSIASHSSPRLRNVVSSTTSHIKGRRCI